MLDLTNTLIPAQIAFALAVITLVLVFYYLNKTSIQRKK